MLNDWFTDLTFDADWEVFQKLPRHPAYRYEFKDGCCWISGRPVFHHAKRNLSCLLESNCSQHGHHWEISPSEQTDWLQASRLFAAAFSRTAPFIHLSEERKLVAANALLHRTQNEEDGPVVRDASLVIRDPKNHATLGMILVTLVPTDDFINFDLKQWSQQPPQDAVKSGWGQPHLTWIFIDPLHSRRGLGEALLRNSAQRLLELGYSTLFSTFLSGNQASTLWHWKMGFQLFSHVSSC